MGQGRREGGGPCIPFDPPVYVYASRRRGLGGLFPYSFSHNSLLGGRNGTLERGPVFIQVNMRGDELALGRGGGERRCAAVRLRLCSRLRSVRATQKSNAGFLRRAGLSHCTAIHNSLPSGRIGARGGGPYFIQVIIMQGLTACEGILGQTRGATPRRHLFPCRLEDTGVATSLSIFRSSGVLVWGLAATIRTGPFGSSAARRRPLSAADRSRGRLGASQVVRPRGRKTALGRRLLWVQVGEGACLRLRCTTWLNLTGVGAAAGGASTRGGASIRRVGVAVFRRRWAAAFISIFRGQGFTVDIFVVGTPQVACHVFTTYEPRTHRTAGDRAAVRNFVYDYALGRRLGFVVGGGRRRALATSTFWPSLCFAST